MKLTKSESGRLGYLASIPYIQNKQYERIKEYLINPTKCQQCFKILEYKQRKNKFCSHICSGFYHNKNKTKKQSRSREQYVQERRKILDMKIESGQIKERKTLKKYIIRTRLKNIPYCEECHLTIWINQPIPLELDHIDGCAANNILSNLRLICPNCHAQTSTSKGKIEETGASL